MGTKTKTGLLVGAVIVLVAVSAAEGIFIYRHTAQPSNTIDENNFDSFSSQLEDLLKRDRHSTWDMFDRFFNDDFFSKNKAPFSEMEQLRKRMNDMMEKEMQGTFDHSWNTWFDDHFLSDNSGVKMQTTDKGNAYIIKLKIPNLKDNHLNIKIDEKGILVDGECTQLAEKKDDKGNVISKQEIHRSMA
jgi:HSP20 family molecular chaperone IbpA